VAACGLAGGFDLPATVFPFILRGVVLAGVDSVMAPMELRLEAWERLAKDLPTEKINDISSTQPMSQLTRLADDIVAGKTRGRIIIDVNA